MMAEGNTENFQQDDFVFDPFGLHSNANTATQEDDSSTRSPQPPPQVNRLTRSTEAPKPTSNATPQPPKPAKAPPSAAVALPPRLVVRFTAHEEVSSVAQTGVENEGSSEVFIEGKLSVRYEIQQTTFIDLLHSAMLRSHTLGFAPLPTLGSSYILGCFEESPLLPDSRHSSRR